MNTRNKFLDLIKWLACFLVIVIHTKGFGVAYEYELALTRWAVPFFFTLTGIYFFKNDLSTENIRVQAKNKTIKYLKLLLIVDFVYLYYSLIWYLCTGFTIQEWLKLKFSLPAIINWLLNWTLIKDNSNYILHLWYLVAVIKSCIVIYIFAPVFKSMYKLITLILLFFLYITNYFYSSQLTSIHFNWWLIGLPFILLGVIFSEYISTNIDKLSEKERLLWQLKTKYIAGSMLFIGIIITYIEVYFLGEREIYLGSLIITICVLFLSECDIHTIKLMDITAPIYFYHVLVLDMVLCYIPEIVWYKPILIFIICVIIFGVLSKLKGVYYGRKRKKVHTFNG